MTISLNDRPLAIIVDDEPGIRALFRRCAEDAGYFALEADNGLGLLDILKTVSPVVIILDLQMSMADGVQTLRQLAERHVAAEILLCSGVDRRTLESTREIAVRQGLKIGALLQKPIRAANLIQQLKNIAIERAVFSEDILRRCLEQKRFTVHYQPKLSLSTLQITGVEALLRCQDEIDRAIPPNVVVETAEACGLIDELTEMVFREALRQQHLWFESGIKLDLAINLSPRCSFGNQLPEILASLCREAKVAEGAVTIELTETAVMNDVLIGMEALIRLRLKGFRLSIDDFGTGYSSLTRLKQLPFSEIKIDKSFVGNLLASRDNIAIVSSILHLAQNMELHSVIEGVEDQATLAFAAERGCDAAQGYFIARPMRGEDVPGFLKSWRWRQESLRTSILIPDTTVSEEDPAKSNGVD